MNSLFKNIFICLLALVLALGTFSGCQNTEKETTSAPQSAAETSETEEDTTIAPDGSKKIMTYGDYNISEKEYKYILANVKTMLVLQYRSFLYQSTGMVYEEADILEMPAGDGSEKTVEAYIGEYAQTVAKQMLIIESFCGENNLEITNPDDLAKVQEYVTDVETAYGGKDQFQSALETLGFSLSGIERFERLQYLYEIYKDYRYGEKGADRVTDEEIDEYFMENYLAYDGCRYAFYDTDRNNYLFEFGSDEQEEYFLKNFVKVRHVLYMTVDYAGNPLDEKLKNDKKSAAENALASIQNGEKTIYDYENMNEDTGNSYVFTYDTMVDEFETASFEMEVGEVRLVETQFGYHLIEKFELTLSELDSDDVKADLAAAMSRDFIRSEANALAAQLNSGELTSYPDESSEKAYYSILEKGIVAKDSQNDAKFVEILETLEPMVYTPCEMNKGYDIYILRNPGLSADDITEEIRTDCRATLTENAYTELLKSNYDAVTIDSTLIGEYNIKALPLLTEEFY